MAAPPNLLAFATGKISMVKMVKHGDILNVFAVIVATIAAFTIFPAVLGYNVKEYPEWA
jgi:sodium-dependent dicarboxylate transporter 2/3/5